MSAPNRADLARAVLFWSAVADEAREQASTARAVLEDAARAELETNGSAPTWRIPDVGTVPLALTTASVQVDDPAAYLKWVGARYPTEVETVTRVRDPFDTRLRRSAAERGDPPCDECGEVIPGLRFVPGGQPRGISVRPAVGAKERIAGEAHEFLSRALAGSDGER